MIKQNSTIFLLIFGVINCSETLISVVDLQTNQTLLFDKNCTIKTYKNKSLIQSNYFIDDFELCNLLKNVTFIKFEADNTILTFQTKNSISKYLILSGRLRQNNGKRIKILKFLESKELQEVTTKQNDVWLHISLSLAYLISISGAIWGICNVIIIFYKPSVEIQPVKKEIEMTSFDISKSFTSLETAV